MIKLLKIKTVIQIIFILTLHTMVNAHNQHTKTTDNPIEYEHTYIYIDEQNEIGQTRLHIAAYNRDKTSVINLITNHADVNIEDWGEWTPLHVAVYVGDEDITHILLEHIANVNKTDNIGQTPELPQNICYRS